MDTRTAVWVSTAEKFSKIVLGKTRNSSRKFRGVSAPALDKNPAVTGVAACFVLVFLLVVGVRGGFYVLFVTACLTCASRTDRCRCSMHPQ